MESYCIKKMFIIVLIVLSRNLELLKQTSTICGGCTKMVEAYEKCQRILNSKTIENLMEN